MLTLNRLSKAFGEKTLFHQVSLQINEGDRIALIGPNGAGKTTFFSILLGELEPDEGDIQRQKNRTIGYLPQETANIPETTVLELAMEVHPEMATLRRILANDPTHHDALDEADHGAAYARYEEIGGHAIEVKAKKILSGLSFRESDFNRPLHTLSGGWIMRTHLARLLVMEPDLLMLDEPTNHLDLHSVLWFQQYLIHYPGALLFISHDRAFLNRLAHSTVELRGGKLTRYRGNYDDYLRLRAESVEQQKAAYKNQQREIERLTRFVERFRSKATKASQAQSKLKQLEKMDRIEAPEEDQVHFKFQFPQPKRSGQRVIRLENVAHSYGSIQVYRQLDFTAERGQRIVLVGPNGAGKSTLLKLLAGVLPVNSGMRELGHEVQEGYFSQQRIEVLKPERTLVEEALDTRQAITEQHARTILGSFLFKGDDVFKKVKVLSGGEKSRLALIKLLLNPPNLLLMDEPTTHLDMMGIEALINALKQFTGTLIFISHDVHFIRSVAEHVIHVEHGTLRHYHGDYDYYLSKREADQTVNPIASDQQSKAASGQQKPQSMNADKSLSSKERRRMAAEERKRRSAILKQAQDKVDLAETTVNELEARQQALTDELEKPETYANGPRIVEINQELTMIAQSLEEAMAHWEGAQQTLETIQQDLQAQESA
jgi:ATP-binding cassette subfamily F protein 3